MVNKHVSVFYIAFTCNCEQPFQASSSQHTRYKIKTHTHTIYIVFCLLLYFTSCKCFEQHQYLVTTNWGTNVILPVHSGTGISHTNYRKEKSMESIWRGEKKRERCVCSDITTEEAEWAGKVDLERQNVLVVGGACMATVSRRIKGRDVVALCSQQRGP